MIKKICLTVIFCLLSLSKIYGQTNTILTFDMKSSWCSDIKLQSNELVDAYYTISNGDSNKFMSKPIQFNTAVPLFVRITNINEYQIRSYWSHDSISWKPLYSKTLVPDTNISERIVTIVYNNTVLLSQNHIVSKCNPFPIKNPDYIIPDSNFIGSYFFHDNENTEEGRKLNELFPDFANHMKSFLIDARSQGYNVTITSQGGLRTFIQQDLLFHKGRKRLHNGKWKTQKRYKVVTNAPGGSSWHNYGLAADIIFYRIDYAGEKTFYYPPVNNIVWKKVIAIGHSYGLESGTDWKHFKDTPHWQLIYNKTIFSGMSERQERNTLLYHYRNNGYYDGDGMYYFLWIKIQENF